ncbi:MAG TPA: RidA family protein [Solirubrobacterales bacterium]|nr:RidA family protein [Solirubrobacterales bacterium]
MEQATATQPQAVHPDPARASEMPYAPAVEVPAGGVIVFISGATASPLYHQHPHVHEEHVQPDDIREQTRRALDNIKLVLDARGLDWRHVIKATKYLTDIREADAMHEVWREYFREWQPASTMICVNNLSSPGARVELDLIALGPPSTV